MALGVQVKEYRAVSIVDGFKADTLAVVVVGFLIFINRSQPPSTYATAYCFLKGVIVGFIGYGCLLVSPVKPIADLGQLVVICAVLAHIIDGNAVVAVFVDDPNDRQHDLVDLKLWLVLVLIGQRAFPLCAAQRVEAPVLQALQALVPQRGLDIVKLPQGFSVQV